jgi:hypothetical protein
LTSCGLATLAHDSVLGPVSPAGRIHEATVGRDFRVTRAGPVADASAEARLRPYPADLIRRLGSPASFRALFQGLQALAAGTSVVIDRRERSGSRPDLDDLPGEGASVQEVFAQLGTPEVWIRRKGGSVAYYRSSSGRDRQVNVGVPPIAAALIPVPGVASLVFRLGSGVEALGGAVLFFDDHDRLTDVAMQRDERSP